MIRKYKTILRENDFESGRDENIVRSLRPDDSDIRKQDDRKTVLPGKQDDRKTTVLQKDNRPGGQSGHIR